MLLAAGAAASLGTDTAGRLDGFNLIAAPGHPLGGASARESLRRAKNAGASAVAIVPFLWQPAPASPRIVRGSDMADDELRQAIRTARRAGLRTIVKPHVWVDRHWAGAVAATSEQDWKLWFDGYRTEIVHLARVAAEERADVFCIGTELTRTIDRPEWIAVIGALRAVFPGRLIYAAHNVEEAEIVPFWSRLDAVGVTLYPSLGQDGDRVFRRDVMHRTADRLDELARRTGKPVIVAEIGLRSAAGAAMAPWESPEERDAGVALELQADVLSDWLWTLDRPSVIGVLVWRWFTDPAAGGPLDTDFTVQNKPAENVFLRSRR
jgi:hypothetical protein